MKKFPMTAEGAKKLREELQRLKSKERPKIMNAISEARAHGDLKENAEYHAAKEQQSFNEGRIAEIEGKLSNAQIIDVRTITPDDKVVFGSTVVLVNTETDEEVQYKIVGDDEADINLGMISVNSPISRAIIGREKGDVVEVKTPNGSVEYEIFDIQYV